MDSLQNISAAEAANGMAGHRWTGQPGVTYQLDVAPFTRYHWNGIKLLPHVDWADAAGSALLDPSGAEVPAGGGGGGGAAAFTDLTDAPSSYAGVAGRVPFVKSDASGLVFGQADGDLDLSGMLNLALTAGDGGNIALTAGADGGNITLNGGADGGEVRLNGGADGGKVHIKGGTVGGDVVIEGGPDGGGLVLKGPDGGIFVSTADGVGRLDLYVNADPGLAINGQTAVASQEVLVAGVGTLTFTHGLLTSFTPA